MTLLILTHLRAGLERKDWRAVERARRLYFQSGEQRYWRELATAEIRRDWGAVEAFYVSLGGMGSGEPAKRPGDPEKARDGVCGGVVPPDALKRARGSAAAPDGWMTLGNVR